ncbi:MAG: porin [Polyangiales bacterium]|nr:hypothetical protein [Myxococcales bacterium]
MTLRGASLGLLVAVVMSLPLVSFAQGTAPTTPAPKTPPAAEAPPAEQAPPAEPTPPAEEAPAAAPAPEIVPPPAPSTEPTQVVITAPVTPEPAPAEPAAADAQSERKGWSRGGAILQEDVEPSVTALHAKNLDVRLGALTQIQFAPYVGEDALIANGDAASEVGFRVRRARLGVEADFGWNLGAFLNLDLLANSSTDGIVSDAKVTWSPVDEARFSVGSGKVPFSRGALLSSRRIGTIERALAVGAITPARRLGFTVEGAVLDGHIAYIGALMNGTDGFGVGNQFGGVLYGGRIELSPFDRPDARDPNASGVSVGGGLLYDDGPGTNTVAWSADIYGALWGSYLTVEVLCNKTTPDDAPLVAPGVADSVRRCGGYVEGGYTLPWRPADMAIQPAVRAEIYDDDRSLKNAGDVIMITAGVNVDVLDPYVRAQLNYVARRERYGQGRANDLVVLSLQGSF